METSNYRWKETHQHSDVACNDVVCSPATGISAVAGEREQDEYILEKGMRYSEWLRESEVLQLDYYG
ncbi:hypothetical protein LSTR_LSTR007959 [Laodelphax striatellus]|uniref:Uncharacterized protein n=1 Tax=Laodelphax striatellus TaxID=195883 RepID=A0A482XFA2_LAOST|nr:hypothetical protein LSTR_LSTR007959 [Laodelphax striatellus]